MAHVDIRWRPSGGRGEYEFVPSEVLLGRRILIDARSVNNGYIETDVRGHLKDGKPRLRRDSPNDRGNLNVPPLVAALAWLPAPRREDKGQLVLPLRDKGYVAASITFEAKLSADMAFLRPMEMRVLHYEYAIDLDARMRVIRNALTDIEGVEAKAKAAEYISIVRSHSATSRLVDLSESLRPQLEDRPKLITGDVELSLETPFVDSKRVTLEDLSAEETRRRLVEHYRIDRSAKLRKAKIDSHLLQHGSVFCENCEFDFAKAYPVIGEGFIEVHHKKQLAALMPSEKTYISDLALLCANCHRMVHRSKPPHSLDFISKSTHFRFVS